MWLNIGKGGPADKSRAFTLCLEAAAAGHLGAMFNAGVYYLSGEGVTADASKAAQWFERSADGGVVQVKYIAKHNNAYNTLNLKLYVFLRVYRVR